MVLHLFLAYSGHVVGLPPLNRILQIDSGAIWLTSRINLRIISHILSVLYSSMKAISLFLSLFLMALFTACDQTPSALKKGVIESVVWAPELNSRISLFRRKVPDNPAHRVGGSYGKDMYGILYTSHLEVQFVDRLDGRSKIIPLSQIILLDFGDGGISFSKP